MGIVWVSIFVFTQILVKFPDYRLYRGGLYYTMISQLLTFFIGFSFSLLFNTESGLVGVSGKPPTFSRTRK